MRTFLLLLLITASAIGQEGIPADVGTGLLPPGLEGESDLKVINLRRIEALRENVEALQARYERGLDNINLLCVAQIELLTAQLDSTTLKKERLDYIENSLKFALLTWQMVKNLQKVGARGGDVATECQSRAAVFRYRAMWLKEKGS